MSAQFYYLNTLSGDLSDDMADLLRELKSSRASPPAATSTPQQSMQMSMNSGFQLQSSEFSRMLCNLPISSALKIYWITTLRCKDSSTTQMPMKTFPPSLANLQMPQKLTRASISRVTRLLTTSSPIHLKGLPPRTEQVRTGAFFVTPPQLTIHRLTS